MVPYAASLFVLNEQKSRPKVGFISKNFYEKNAMFRGQKTQKLFFLMRHFPI